VGPIPDYAAQGQCSSFVYLQTPYWSPPPPPPPPPLLIVLGTPHFQGYVEFTNRKRLTELRRLDEWHCHWEARRGTRFQARDYAMKEDTRTDGPFEIGEWDGIAQGKRNDLNECALMIKEGATLQKIAEEYPTQVIRYARGLSTLINLNKPADNQEAPSVTLLYGPPGCGKTRQVREAHPADLWVAPINSNFTWFDGYQSHPAVLFDDFDGKMSQVKLSNLLTTIDRYVVSVPVKGSHIWFNPKAMYITTNYHPSEWYDWGDRLPQFNALKRRFTKVIYWPAAWQHGDAPVPGTVVLPGLAGWQQFWDRQY